MPCAHVDGRQICQVGRWNHRECFWGHATESRCILQNPETGRPRQRGEERRQSGIFGGDSEQTPGKALQSSWCGTTKAGGQRLWGVILLFFLNPFLSSFCKYLWDICRQCNELARDLCPHGAYSLDGGEATK